MSIYTLTLGKFLNGLFVTVVHVVTLKMINESVPTYLLGRYGALVTNFIYGGYCFVMVIGKLLPQDDYNPELLNDSNNLKAL